MILILVFRCFSAITSNGNRDFYQILELDRNCTQREIEKRFRSISQEMHPDKVSQTKSSTDIFSDINDAYSTLKDPNKRRIFDFYGESGVHISESPSNEMDPVFSLLGIENEQQYSNLIKRRGIPLRLEFPVPLVDFLNGKQYQFEISRDTICRCSTEGYLCEKCRGNFLIPEVIKKNIQVEKGMPEGSLQIFQSFCDSSDLNGAGNLEIEIISISEEDFWREEFDLHMKIDLTLNEALFGFEKSILHLDGSNLKIVSKNQIFGDKVFRIKSKGFPIYQSAGDFGDLVLHSRINWKNA